MTTSSKAARIAAFTMFIVASPAVATAQTAQPSAADLESARELYKEAKALREAGDLKGALEKFKQAHAYGQTPVTALELGRTHMQLGELVEAREVLLSVGRMKVQSDETDKSAAARQEADQLAEEVRAKIPTLVIKLDGVPAGSNPTVTVDGAALPVVSASATRKTNPGTHAIVARAGNLEAKADVTVAAGETKEVPLVLAAGAASTPPATGGTPPDKSGDGKSGGMSPVVWAGLGIGVAGIAVGTVTGILALGKASKVKNACTGLQCPPSAKSDFDSGRTLATISTVGFIVGAVGLAAGAVGFFVLSPKKTGSVPSVRAVAALNWMGVDGSF